MKPIQNIQRTFDLQRRITRSVQFSKLSPASVRVWYDLWHYHAMGDDDRIFPSQRTLSENLHLSLRSVSSAMTQLREFELIHPVDTLQSGVVVYILSEPPWAAEGYVETCVGGTKEPAHPPERTCVGGTKEIAHKRIDLKDIPRGWNGMDIGAPPGAGGFESEDLKEPVVSNPFLVNEFENTLKGLAGKWAMPG